MLTSRDKESGFALLLVFLMAAIIAISLYSEIPRVAFQSQRQKEQLLMERGEQYQRAIQVFYLSTNQFPRSMDDLEKYQNRRFLRHKYIDPMTGKQEWRIIHVGPGGVPTDSALTKQKKDDSSGSISNYVTAYAGIGQDAGAAGQQPVRPESRRRPSEGGGFSSDSTLPGSTPDQAGQNPTPGAQETASGAPPAGATGIPAGVPGAAAPGDAANPANPGAASGDQSQSQANGGPQVQPGIVIPGQSQNPAMDIIQRQLAGANPRAAQVIQQQQGLSMVSGSTSSGSTSGGAGGVGGVASTAEMEGIMVYNDATSYDKWEFLFSPSALIQVPALGTGQNAAAPSMPLTPQQPNRQQGSSSSQASGGTGRGSFSLPSTGSQNSGSPGTGSSSTGASSTGASLPAVRMGRP